MSVLQIKALMSDTMKRIDCHLIRFFSNFCHQFPKCTSSYFQFQPESRPSPVTLGARLTRYISRGGTNAMDSAVSQSDKLGELVFYVGRLQAF